MELSNEQIQQVQHAATQCLKLEIEVLNGLTNSINADFLSVVGEIYHSKGRVVISGIGKSAIVGQKIVATLNSTGTPALFMHAADAIHGDLGMVRPDDRVLIISKSGESAEIKALVPLVKNMGNRLFAMVSNLASHLAISADLVLWTPIPYEAEPNNLAPTASTTAQMAFGDAIAVALLGLRGFTPKDFAQFHPGGSLGKQLYLRVSDLYIHNAKPAVGPFSTLSEVIVEISSKRLGACAVIDDQSKVLGIITDGDLRRMLSQHTDFGNLKAKDIMSKDPKTIPSDIHAVEALNMMRTFNISQLIVEDRSNYLGILHMHDLVKEGII